MNCYRASVPLITFLCVDDDDDDSDDEATAAKQNACSIIWEGKVLDRAFTDWKVNYL